jgi:hypothetical protein
MIDQNNILLSGQIETFQVTSGLVGRLVLQKELTMIGPKWEVLLLLWKYCC